jgi:hypothetical protein
VARYGEGPVDTGHAVYVVSFPVPLKASPGLLDLADEIGGCQRKR